VAFFLDNPRQIGRCAAAQSEPGLDHRMVNAYFVLQKYILRGRLCPFTNITAAAVTSVSKLFFFDPTIRHPHARVVGPTGLNVCSPRLAAAPLPEALTVRLQQLGAAAAASHERPDKVGGAGH